MFSFGPSVEPVSDCQHRPNTWVCVSMKRRPWRSRWPLSATHPSFTSARLPRSDHPLRRKHGPVISPLSGHSSQIQVQPSYLASIRPYLSNASTAQLFSLYQTIPPRCQYCPVITASIRPYVSDAGTAQLVFISCLIQAWLLQFYPLWPSISFTEPTTKSSEQCCKICPPRTQIWPVLNAQWKDWKK